MIGAIPIKGVYDIFVGGYHCFALAERKKKDGSVHHVVHAWGKNNWGQLGIGTEESTHHVTEVETLHNMLIKDIVGGEDHTLFLTTEGDLYACGRNDDCQLGPINEDDIPMTKPNEDDLDRYAEEAKRNAEAIKLAHEAGLPLPEKYEAPKEVKRNDTVNRPIKVDLPEKISHIEASAHYNIVSAESKQFYSWGLGFSYVLGNGKDEEVKEPYAIKPEFFHKHTVGHLSLGSSHAVYAPGKEHLQNPALEFALDKIAERLPKLKPKPKVHSIESSLERRITQKAKENKKKRNESKSKSKDKSKTKSRAPSKNSSKMPSPVKDAHIHHHNGEEAN